MTIFSSLDALSILGLAAFNYVQFATSNGFRWYNSQRPSWAPPGWIFPIVWFLLYSMTTISGYYFIKSAPADSWELITGFTLYFVHMVTNKLWSVFFWSSQSPLIALFILIFIMLPTGIAFIVVVAVNGSYLFEIPVVLFSVYMGWLFYATALNVYWVTNKLATK